MRFLPSLFNRQAVAPVERKSYTIDPGLSVIGSLLSSLRDPRQSWPFERAVTEGFERVIWVFKSVDAIASQAAKVPFVIEVPGPGGEMVPNEDDPLVALLNSGRANVLETGRQFRERLSGQVLLSRRGAFVEVTTSNRGHIVGVDLLPPGRTRPVPGADGSLLSHYEVTTPDGQRRAIPPEKVRWFRKVHPGDAYAAMTPLEAAGLSVDLDFLARLYNATFLRNDGRPGGVIGIDGEVDETEMKRIQGMFGKGPLEAGKLAVLQGDLKFLEVGGNPRDMAYADLARISREEILAAFGVPESVIGNASGRTFSNAEQEEENFWQFTMDAHLSLLATGWDDDAGEGGRAGFDLSEVPAFQRIAQRKRQEAREEFSAGLISLNEYRARAGLDPIDTAQARALWLPQGKLPIPASAEDAAELGMGQELDGGGAPALPQGGGDQQALPPGDDATPGGEVASQPGAAEAMSRLQGMLEAGAPDAQPAMDALPAGNPATPREGKALLAGPEGPPAPDGDMRDRLAADLGEALARLATRMVERTAARVQSPRQRKGTRHFQPEYKVDTRVGDAPLDAERIADEQQWTEDAEKTLGPLVAAAAVAGVLALGLPGLPGLPVLPGLAGAGAAGAGALAGLGLAALTSGDTDAAGVDVAAILPGELGDTVTAVADTTTRWLARQVAGAAVRLGSLIADADRAGRDMAEIVAGVRGQLPGLVAWARRVADQVTNHVVHAAQMAAAALVVRAGGMATARWTSRRDERVRPSHVLANGQLRPPGERFEVGEVLLRWPRDIEGPPDEVRSCRCRLTWLLSFGDDAEARRNILALPSANL